LVERRSPKPDVVGSSPTGRDFLSFCSNVFAYWVCRYRKFQAVMSITTTPNTSPAAKGNESVAQSSEEQGLGWVKGMGLEWSKITWPTKMQLVTNVIVVLLMTTAMTLFLWLIDTFFRWGIHLITPDKMGR